MFLRCKSPQAVVGKMGKAGEKFKTNWRRDRSKQKQF